MKFSKYLTLTVAGVGFVLTFNQAFASAQMTLRNMGVSTDAATAQKMIANPSLVKDYQQKAAPAGMPAAEFVKEKEANPAVPTEDIVENYKLAHDPEAKRKAEEEARKKAADEAEAKRKADEEARKKAADEAEAKRKAEEEARKKAAEEAEAKRKADEEARKKAAEEAEAKRKADEEARKKAAGGGDHAARVAEQAAANYYAKIVEFDDYNRNAKVEIFGGAKHDAKGLVLEIHSDKLVKLRERLNNGNPEIGKTRIYFQRFMPGKKLVLSYDVFVEDSK